MRKHKKNHGIGVKVVGSVLSTLVKEAAKGGYVLEVTEPSGQQIRYPFPGYHGEPVKNSLGQEIPEGVAYVSLSSSDAQAVAKQVQQWDVAPTKKGSRFIPLSDEKPDDTPTLFGQTIPKPPPMGPAGLIDLCQKKGIVLTPGVNGALSFVDPAGAMTDFIKSGLAKFCQQITPLLTAPAPDEADEPKPPEEASKPKTPPTTPKRQARRRTKKPTSYSVVELAALWMLHEEHKLSWRIAISLMRRKASINYTRIKAAALGSPSEALRTEGQRLIDAMELPGKTVLRRHISDYEAEAGFLLHRDHGWTMKDAGEALHYAKTSMQRKLAVWRYEREELAPDGLAELQGEAAAIITRLGEFPRFPPEESRNAESPPAPSLTVAPRMAAPTVMAPQTVADVAREAAVAAEKRSDGQVEVRTHINVLRLDVNTLPRPTAVQVHDGEKLLGTIDLLPGGLVFRPPHCRVAAQPIPWLAMADGILGLEGFQAHARAYRKGGSRGPE